MFYEKMVLLKQNDTVSTTGVAKSMKLAEKNHWTNQLPNLFGELIEKIPKASLNEPMNESLWWTDSSHWDESKSPPLVFSQKRVERAVILRHSKQGSPSNQRKAAVL